MMRRRPPSIVNTARHGFGTRFSFLQKKKVLPQNTDTTSCYSFSGEHGVEPSGQSSFICIVFLRTAATYPWAGLSRGPETIFSS